MEADGSIDWPIDSSIGKALDIFQKDLLCPICHELMTNPHSTPCGHSFCSLCIRRHCDTTLNVNRAAAERCPTCKEKLDVVDLRKNSSLSSLVLNYKTLGKQLYDAIFSQASASFPASALKSTKKVRVVTPGHGKRITSRVTQYQLHGSSKEYVKKCIEDVTKDSKVKLKSDGSKDILERRLRELIHLINSQVGMSESEALTLDECVEKINSQVRILLPK